MCTVVEKRIEEILAAMNTTELVDLQKTHARTGFEPMTSARYYYDC